MDLDREIDALYTGSPESFVAARDALAKRLREDGSAEEAAAVKALRRPTVAACALNRLAHERPKSLQPLFDLARDLRKAQRGALSGLRGAALREAVRRRRSVVDALADEALALLEAGGRPAESQREAITRTLEAASADPGSADAVRAGRLERELQRPTGFGELTGLAPVPDAAGGEPEAGARPRKGPAKPAPPREDPKLRRLRVQRDEAADAARSAAQAAVRAGERAVEASRDAEAAAREIDVLERGLRAARRRERESSEAAAETTATVKRAESEAERARRKVEDLQARIERLLES
jgi:hypothetical protein